MVNRNEIKRVEPDKENFKNEVTSSPSDKCPMLTSNNAIQNSQSSILSVEIENLYFEMEKGNRVFQFESDKKWAISQMLLYFKPETNQLILSKMSKNSNEKRKKLFLDLHTIIEVQTVHYKTACMKIEDKSKNKQFEKYDGKKIIDICFGTSFVPNHWILRFEIIEACDLWKQGLDHLIIEMKQTSNNIKMEKWLRKKYGFIRKLSLNKNEIAMEELQPFICSAFQYECTGTEHKEIKEGVSDFESFNLLIKILSNCGSLFKAIFQVTIKVENNQISFEQLAKFITSEQQDEWEDDNQIKIFLQEYTREFYFSRNLSDSYLTTTEFMNYLFSPKNSIFDPKNEEVIQDMSQPLTNYWIASSHNTYLTGDQIRSESSLDAYSQALLMGCRCIELDCWDGNNNDILWKKCVKRGILYLQDNTHYTWTRHVFVLFEDKLCYVTNSLDSKELIDEIEDTIIPTSFEENQNEKSRNGIEVRPEEMHETEEWFHGKIDIDSNYSSEIAMGRLMEQKDKSHGVFLVRESARFIGDYTLSLLHERQVYHLQIKTKIINEEKIYYFFEEKPLNTLYELILYYTKNYLETEMFKTRLYTPCPHPQPHLDQPWFADKADKKRAEELLNTLCEDGAFLIRYSSSNHKVFVLSFSWEGKIWHYRLKQNGKVFVINPIVFENLNHIVDYYSQHAFVGDVYLRFPVNERNVGQIAPADPNYIACGYHVNLSDFDKKVVAIALQAYLGPDSRYLSFPANAIIKVIKKKNNLNNMWMGRYEHFTGLFPPEVVKKVCITTGKGISEAFSIIELVDTCIEKWHIDNKPYAIRISSACHSSSNEWILSADNEKEMLDWYTNIREKTIQTTSLKLIKTKKEYTTRIATELSNLVVYCQLSPFNPNFMKETKFYEMCSFSEHKHGKLIEKGLLIFNTRHLSRVYPQASRLSSTNFMPVTMWNTGCHMAALNYQTPDKSMQLNQGKFMANGRCGYVLKPAYMLDDTFSIESPESINGNYPIELTIEIIAGRYLSRNDKFKSICSPFVDIDVVGLPFDYHSYRTTSVPSNGLNPIWRQSFTFKISCPEMALLRFNVEDGENVGSKSDPFIGQAVYPVDCLRGGYRSVPLLNSSSEPLELSSLLVHVNIECFKYPGTKMVQPHYQLQAGRTMHGQKGRSHQSMCVSSALHHNNIQLGLHLHSSFDSPHILSARSTPSASTEVSILNLDKNHLPPGPLSKLKSQTSMQSQFTSADNDEIKKLHFAMERGHKVYFFQLNSISNKWEGKPTLLYFKPETYQLVLSKKRRNQNEKRKKLFLDLQTIIEVQTVYYKTAVMKIKDKWKNKQFEKYDGKEIIDICFGTSFVPNHWVLRFDTMDACEIWKKGINLLINENKQICHSLQMKKWLRKQYIFVKKSSLNKSEITHQEMQSFFHFTLHKKVQNLQLRAHPEYIKTFEDFNISINLMLHLDNLFHKVFEDSIKVENCKIAFKQIVLFIKIQQQDEWEEESQIKTFLQEYTREFYFSRNLSDSYLTTTEFMNYLFSPKNSIFDPKNEEVIQDMSQPLTNYWIASSHNTYLTGDQIRSESSLDAYSQALLMGCRCIELDCWDGSIKSSGEPNDVVIYHGYTMTSKLNLRDVLYIIKRYAFITSKYPVILSIEDRCSLPFQKIIAKDFKEILEDYLLLSPISKNETQLPSPDALRKKIIIKHKKLPIENENNEQNEVSEEYQKRGELDFFNNIDYSWSRKVLLLHGKKLFYSGIRIKNIDDSGYESQKEDEGIDWEKNENIENGVIFLENCKVEKFSIGSKPSIKISRLDSEWILSDVNEKNISEWYLELQKECEKSEHVGITDPQPQIKNQKICLELSNMVVYCQATHFKVNFKETMNFCEMTSLKENSHDKLVEKDLIQFNMKHLSRVYPHASRITSSNYIPTPMWNTGCHMVALNYQTPDKSMQLNQGKFMANGRCGYVLKPAYMLDDTFSIESPESINGNYPIELTIEIIAGRYLSRYDKAKGICSPFVEVETIGMRKDSKSYRTNTVLSNGLNPAWKQRFVFEIICPEMALLRFNVEDGENVGSKSELFIGQAVYPVNCIRNGYRSVPLLNQSSEPLELSSLLVHVKIQSLKTPPVKILRPSQSLKTERSNTQKQEDFCKQVYFDQNPSISNASTSLQPPIPALIPSPSLSRRFSSNSGSSVITDDYGSSKFKRGSWPRIVMKKRNKK